MFPFNLFTLGGLAGVNSAQQQGMLGTVPFPLFGTWPFSGQQQTQSGMVATLPWPVDAYAYKEGLVPTGLPLIPPVSDIPDAVVDMLDIMWQAPETALTQSMNTVQGQQQQQGNTVMNAVTSAMTGVTSTITGISSAIRTMTRTMVLAPETVREDFTGQQAVQDQIVEEGAALVQQGQIQQ
jgi:hypothetical protein